MMLKVLFAAGPDRWPLWRAPLEAALHAAGIPASLSPDHPPEAADYIIYAPGGPLTDFTPCTRARAVLCLWAGVESIVTNPTLTQPLARMVDPGLTQGMVDYVTGHVLRHHLVMDAHILRQAGWAQIAPPLASERPVTLLGLGALGQACATALTGLGFPVTGWSRTAHDLPGVTCLSGPTGLDRALATAQIVVTLLPLTPDTENTLNARSLAQLPAGAIVINPGRGALIDDAALLAALDAGQLGHATLDVFRTEPLPADHRYWTHSHVTVTPHVAADTRPRTAAPVIAENIRRSEAGQPLLHRVDRTRGY